MHISLFLAVHEIWSIAHGSRVASTWAKIVCLSDFILTPFVLDFSGHLSCSSIPITTWAEYTFYQTITNFVLKKMSWKSDRALTKAFVCFVIIADTVQQILLLKTTYMYLVQDFGDFVSLEFTNSYAEQYSIHQQREACSLSTVQTTGRSRVS